MAPPRRFDHDEARRLRAEGWTLKQIADKFSVSSTAVNRVTNPVVRARMEETHRQWGRASCHVCGAPAQRIHFHGKAPRCRNCAANVSATSVRPGTLRCKTCREWKPDEAFPRNRGGTQRRRGRHDQCRACATKARQAYRARHKVPCVGCGKPALPPSEKTTNGTGEPRCRECMYEAYRQPEYREAASERARAVHARKRVAA